MEVFFFGWRRATQKRRSEYQVLRLRVSSWQGITSGKILTDPAYIDNHPPLIPDYFFPMP
jgi:hypothetical protein